MATPHLGERSVGVAQFILTNRPSIAQYRFVAGNTLANVFPTGTTMFTIPKGSWFRSPTLQRNSVSRVEENFRGRTIAQVNFDDYAAATVHGDSAINFVRVVEIDKSGAVLPAGPIVVVPPANFFTSAHRSIFFTGTAPDVASLTTGLPPAGAMVISFPRMCDDLVITNNSVGDDLYVSLGDGMPEQSVPASGGSVSLTFGGTAVYLHGDGAAVSFSLSATVVSGLR
tara:strand:- start:486 stop:1166 length:681 start_codon:yes stop_codon:yes gene_type:complete